MGTLRIATDFPITACILLWEQGLGVDAGYRVDGTFPRHFFGMTFALQLIPGTGRLFHRVGHYHFRA